jgi:TolB-like protein/DNA-binding winged helix-turn-helix (wHTH) protein
MSLEIAGLGRDFRIGDWVVSPALNQVSRNGSCARLEPKAMQVLVYLAENPGVVSKNQLISAVWPDVFVSDDVLPGCVSALRKAFGDNARQPQVIETIHKGGYRLLLPVQRMNGNGQVAAAPPSPNLSLRRRLISDRLISHRWAIAATIVIATLILIAAFSRPPARQHFESIAVLPFANSAGDSATQYLSDGVAEQVINDLSQVQNLQVLAWTTVSRYRQPQTDIRAVGRELDVKAVLTGRLVRHDDRVILQTELVDVGRGSQLWGQQYDRGVSDLVSLQEQLSKDIAANLRVRLSGGRAT